jgi:hypothetical protein
VSRKGAPRNTDGLCWLCDTLPRRKHGGKGGPGQ